MSSYRCYFVDETDHIAGVHFVECATDGLAQASAWTSAGQQIVKSFVLLKPYFYLRSIFGGMIWLGALLQLINVVMTLRQPAENTRAERLAKIGRVEEIPEPAR